MVFDGSVARSLARSLTHIMLPAAPVGAAWPSLVRPPRRTYDDDDDNDDDDDRCVEPTGG